MTDTLDSDNLDSDNLDSGCVDDSSDPVGSDDPSADDACSDDPCSDDPCSDDPCSDDRADACGTDGRDDGACDTEPACWDDTLCAVPGAEVAAEVAPSPGPAPLVALPAAALASLPTVPAPSPFAGVPGVGGDTEAVLTSVSRQLADAGTIAHAPLGVADPAVDAAIARAERSGRAADSTAAVAAEQEIVNSVREGELVRSATTESRREEAAAQQAVDTPSSTLGTF